jgi:heme A synthase
MRSAYRVLAYIIAALVALQSAVVVLAIFGLFNYIDQGGVVDAAAQQNVTFFGDIGFMLHGIGGQFVVPLFGLLLLISSFFAKIPGGIRWALIVFGVIVIQVALGLFGFSAPVLGFLHGLNALILFGLAVTAAMRVKRAAATAATPAATVGAPAPVVQ